jgi:hypothetical protein
MSYLKSFNESSLCKLILQTNKELFLAMPLIHPELLVAIHSLYSKHNGKVSINIGLDFSSETFRQGYGELDAFEKTNLNNYNCQNINHNRISFIITDDIGYFLFIESRYLIPAEKETINAISIDPISIVRLKHHFFKPFEKNTLEDLLSNAIIDESIRIKDVEKEFQSPGIISTNKLNEHMIQAVSADLKSNPPLRPDYKRIVEYYATKFQYVKLVFHGANLQAKKVELPKKALPVNDAALRKRLETKLNLFNPGDEEAIFPELEDIKIKIKLLREYYLVPLKIREENLIELEKKEAFEKDIRELEQHIVKISATLIQKIEDMIQETKNNLLSELVTFYTENPKQISDNDLFLKADKTYRERVAKNKANEIIHNIRWPEAFELASKMSMQLLYSNITFEDLSNKDLLDELISRGVITDADKTSLAVFRKGINLDKI